MESKWSLKIIGDKNIPSRNLMPQVKYPVTGMGCILFVCLPKGSYEVFQTSYDISKTTVCSSPT